MTLLFINWGFIIQYNNIIIEREMLPATNTTALFYVRFKKYLSFLQITNHQDILISILSFLDLHQLLQFLSTSSYFNAFKNIQSIELRILRRKLMFYEKDKQDVKIDPSLFYLKLNLNNNTPYSKPQQMIRRYQSLVMKLTSNNNKIKSYQLMKNLGLQLKSEQLKKITKQYNKNMPINSENMQQNQVKVVDMNDLKAELNKNRQNQIGYYSRYKNLIKKNQNHSDNKIVSRKPQKIVEYNSSVSKLQARQYEQAKLDYMKRKMKSRNLIDYEQLKRMAEYDPCSRQIFNKLYKKEYQEQNISRLKMKPTPNIKNDDIQSYLKSQTMEVKNTMAQNMLISLKGMIGKNKQQQ